MSLRRKPFVLGLTWRKLGKTEEELTEDENETSPVKKTRTEQDENSVVTLGARGTTLRRTLSRMQSVRAVRDAFGTIRQKLRPSTRRRKRLVNASPFTPKRRTATSTPNSVQRRSARLAQQQEDKLYTPFNVDTPSKTPSKIRMGVHEPKRFNFSSPGQLYRDVNSVTDGIRVLADMSDRLNQAS